jgi:L-aspartate oxidase
LDGKVTINENETAVELRVNNGSCSGVITKTADGSLKLYQANNTVLATGGIGQLYPCTTNDVTITGDGIALAHRAGCRLENLEFMQFHPTLLSINGKTMGLVSEAVRGEGAVLVNDKGEKIMKDFLPFKDLSPRDVVSREVYAHSLKGEKIYLDISNVECFKERFPSVTEICESNGVSVSDNLIPVSPGAHFYMGGVKAGSNGETNIDGLYAVGEVSCTGVHGANRLASNSLLEGLAFGKLTACNIIEKNRKAPEMEDVFSSAEIGELPTKDEIRKNMMEFMGIVRYEDKISKLISYFEKFMYADNFGKIDISKASLEQLEIYNMITAGWLCAKAGFKRKTSIGAHCIN